jgi:uncharacterized integral membrane protein (TIGR00698 family)
MTRATNNDLETDTEAAHEIYQSPDGMEGSSAPVAPLPLPAQWASGLEVMRAVYPGLLVAATIAMASAWLSLHYGAPVMLFALLFGMAFNFLHDEPSCIRGIEFSSKAVLRLGVALLGARITAAQILSLGVMPIATVIIGVGTTIGVGYLVARALGQSREYGVLSGGAVGICGASAALAIAAVLPRNPKAERDTILTVVSITALSTLAMILYPLIAVGVGLDYVRAGIFLGGTIHDVAQVVGAGFSISPQTGDIATYVKLLRVAMLLPVVFALAFIAGRAKGEGQAGPNPPVPLFLIGFAALVVVNSFGFLPKAVTGAASSLSNWCLVTAIAALGMKTSFKDLFAVGWRPIAVMIIETVWIFALVMAAVQIFH